MIVRLMRRINENDCVKQVVHLISLSYPIEFRFWWIDENSLVNLLKLLRKTCRNLFEKFVTTFSNFFFNFFEKLVETSSKKLMKLYYQNGRVQIGHCNHKKIDTFTCTNMLRKISFSKIMFENVLICRDCNNLFKRVMFFFSCLCLFMSCW